MKKRILAAIFAVLMLLSFSACTPKNEEKDNSSGSENVSAPWPELVVGETPIPAYSGTAFYIVNENIPTFSEDEKTTSAYESYSDLDSLGRCGVAIASCGIETMPKPDEDRGSISSVKPSGWVQAQYDFVSGGYLWNRAHLIGWQLSAENANRRNLITGTYYMNHEGMLPFENMVADYIKETQNHVAYRITPIFLGDNLVCHGVQMEAYSIEDNGEGISFNVFCYNVEPGVIILYETGVSYAAGESAPSEGGEADGAESGSVPSEGTEAEPSDEKVYVSESGTKYHTDPTCSGMTEPQEMSKAEAEAAGYTDCKRC